jgi:ATP-dependent Clp protease ATP-binding subunit ClpX
MSGFDRTPPTQRIARDNTLYCSFCGKSQRDVFHLIAGPACFICDECIGLCVIVIDNARKAQGPDAGTGEAPAPQPPTGASPDARPERS